VPLAVDEGLAGFTVTFVGPAGEQNNDM
jgi:hypothetical protein